MTGKVKDDSVCLCVFARAPVPGRVKTRLLSCMDAESACALHQQLIEQCLSRTVRNGLWASQLWGTDKADGFLNKISAQHGIALHMQQGKDLGWRMANAVKESMRAYQRVIVIGTDCPELDALYIERVIQKLQAGADCILGPAEDGGYVMLALSCYDDSLFADIEWGTDRVLDTTRERIKALGWYCEEMPVLWDVDRPEDYERLRRIDECDTRFL